MQVPTSCNRCRTGSGATVMGKSLTHLGTVGGLLNIYVTFPLRKLLVARQKCSVGHKNKINHAEVSKDRVVPVFYRWLKVSAFRLLELERMSQYRFFRRITWNSPRDAQRAASKRAM